MTLMLNMAEVQRKLINKLKWSDRLRDMFQIVAENKDWKPKIEKEIESTKVNKKRFRDQVYSMISEIQPIIDDKETLSILFENATGWPLTRNESIREHHVKAIIDLNKLNNPDITNKDLAKVAWTTEKSIEAFAHAPVISNDGVDELYSKNVEIITHGKQVILDRIKELKPENLSELKIMSDILETSFKQNRLIDNKSTANVWLDLWELYDAIVDKSNEIKNGQIIDAEIID